MTINVLPHTLTNLNMKGEVHFFPILHIHLDNTVKDIKSKYIMAYLQALVECGVFEEITRAQFIFSKSVTLTVT